MKSRKNIASLLCLQCGICCDGTLFKDVELQAPDDSGQLRALGMSLKRIPGPRANADPQRLRFTQPCAALCVDLRCKIYAQRPTHCRDFECALFKAVATGQIEATIALRKIRSARQLAGRVRQLLAELDETETQLALSVRFRRLARRIERAALDETKAALFGELTLAMQDLNFILSREFYPGSAGK